MNPLWKVYKSKVLKTLNPEHQEDTVEEACEVENDVGPVQEDEGPNAVSHFAKRVQGASVRGWNKMSALFNKDDEHQLLEETENLPVADHPLAVKPEEAPRPGRRSGFWDSFAANWAAKKQAEAEAAAAVAVVGESGPCPVDGEEAAEGEEGGSEAAPVQNRDGQEAEESTESKGGEVGSGSNNSFSKYMALGSEDASFKWNFVTNKLAELKTKSGTKTN